MKYNLAKYSQLTTSGTISLEFDDLINIVSSTSANISVSSGTLYIECDLGSRVHIDELRYYTTNSGIKFYYKNESFESYTELTTYYSGSYFYTTISGYSAPRFIKTEYIATESGILNGFVVQNNEDYVDFGEDSTMTSYNINSSLEDAEAQISELFVYNSSPKTATAKVFIEPQNSAIDNILFISNNSSGPWYGIYQDEDKISGSYKWDEGSFNNTETSAEVLKLSSGNTYGTYTTKIFDLEEYQKLTYIVSDIYYPNASSILAVDAIDTYETLEVRNSNNRPLDFVTVIDLYTPDSSNKYLRHRWALDGSLESAWDTTEIWSSSGNYFDIFYDNITDDVYLIDKGFYTGYYGTTNIRFHIFRNNGNGSHYELSIYSQDYDYSCAYTTYKLCFNSYGGFWIYYHYGSDDIAKYFYLDYYNSSLSRTKRISATDSEGTFLYDMSAVYESEGDLWYTDTDQNAIYKINKSGNIIASRAETNTIRGVTALNDGGCWYISGSNLVRLNSSAVPVDSFDLGTSTASYVYLDPTGEGFWIHDSNFVIYYNSTGSQVFSVELIDLILITAITSDGVITKQHNGSTSEKPQASYISKYEKRVIRTWNYAINEGGWKGLFDSSRFGARSYTYDDINNSHSSYFPISLDNNWQNLSWNKVSLRDYNFSDELYHQLRLSLRADSSSNSPQVNGLWTQRAVELLSVPSGNYRSFYLKTDPTDLTQSDTGSYSSSIRAWWYLEEN